MVRRKVFRASFTTLPATIQLEKKLTGGCLVIMTCRLSVLSLETDDVDDEVVVGVCIGQLCDSSSPVAEENARVCCFVSVVITNDEFPVVALLVSGAEWIFVFSFPGVLFCLLRAPAVTCFGEELT